MYLYISCFMKLRSHVNNISKPISQLTSGQDFLCLSQSSQCVSNVKLGIERGTTTLVYKLPCSPSQSHMDWFCVQITEPIPNTTTCLLGAALSCCLGCAFNLVHGDTQNLRTLRSSTVTHSEHQFWPGTTVEKIWYHGIHQLSIKVELTGMASISNKCYDENVSWASQKLKTVIWNLAWTQQILPLRFMLFSSV